MSRSRAWSWVIVGAMLSACFAPGGSAPLMMQDPASPPPPSMAPSGAGARAADGRWELARPGEPPLVLEVRGDVVVIEDAATGAATEVLARTSDGSFEAPRDSTGIKADVSGSSCVEIVSVEAEELVVKIGKMIDDRCVLSDQVLRLARQIQR